MSNEHVLYLGRMVPKDTFRAYIYGADGQTHLADSWDEFQEHISTGVWFDTVEKSKRVKKKGKV